MVLQDTKLIEIQVINNLHFNPFHFNSEYFYHKILEVEIYEKHYNKLKSPFVLFSLCSYNPQDDNSFLSSFCIGTMGYLVFCYLFHDSEF